MTMTSRLAVAGCVPESIVDEVQRWDSAPGVGRWMDTEFDVSALVKQMAGSGRFVGKYPYCVWLRTIAHVCGPSSGRVTDPTTSKPSLR